MRRQRRTHPGRALMRLEERIVLSGAGLPDLDDATAPDAVPDTAPDDTPHPETAEPLRVLLLSSAVEEGDLLADTVGSNVIVQRFDHETDTPGGILDSLAGQLEGREAESIALATHGGPAALPLTRDAVLTLDTLGEPEMQAFFDGLAALLAPEGRIDLLGCDLADGADGQVLVAALEEATGVDIAASDDATGAEASGGDWILETDGVDVAALYFQPDSLQAYTGLLPGNLPSDLTILDTTPAAVESLLETLTPAGATANDDFGYAIDVTGNRLAIGAPGAGGDQSGRVYTYEWNGSAWTALTGPLGLGAGVAGDQFGAAVAINDTWLVVGAPGDDGTGNTHIYSWNGGTTSWDTSQIITGGAAGDAMGTAVALSTDRVVTGAPGNDDAGADAGEVYAYSWGGFAWIQDGGDISPAGAAAGDGFGTAVAVDGTEIVAGAPGRDLNGTDDGAGYAFHWTGAAWNEVDLMGVNGLGDGSALGTSAAIDGSRVVLGAPGSGTGAAYLWSYGGGHWGTLDGGLGAYVPDASFLPSGGAAGDAFGSSVALNEGILLVGAPGADVDGKVDAGSAWAFVHDGAAWGAGTGFFAASPDAGDGFGSAVGLYSESLLVGAPDGGPAPEGGTVTRWGLEAAVEETATGGTVVGSLLGTDADGDALSYSIIGGATNVFEIVGNELRLKSGASLDHETTDAYSLTLRVSDVDGNYDETFIIHVGDINEAPAAGTIPGQTAEAESAFSYTVPSNVFADPDAGDVLSWSAAKSDGSPLPAWLAFNPASRTFSGTPTGTDTGTLTIRVTATDTGGLSASAVFALAVDPAAPPPFIPPGDDGGETGGTDPGSGEDTGDPDDAGGEGDSPMDDGGGLLFDADAGGFSAADAAGWSNAAAAALPASIATPEERDRAEGGSEDAMNGLAADGDLVLSMRLADLAFVTDVLFDPNQPEEIRGAFQTILQTYVQSNEELAAYLQSAFRSVAEAALLHRDADSLEEAARVELTRLREAGAESAEPFAALLARTGTLSRQDRIAVEELRRVLLQAASTGEDGLDRTLEDVVNAALVSLNDTNDDLTIAMQSLRDLARSVRETPDSELAVLEYDALAEAARGRAEAALRATRQRWDLVAEDVFAAFVKRLATERAEASAPSPPGE